MDKERKMPVSQAGSSMDRERKRNKCRLRKGNRRGQGGGEPREQKGERKREARSQYIKRQKEGTRQIWCDRSSLKLIFCCCCCFIVLFFYVLMILLFDAWIVFFVFFNYFVLLCFCLIWLLKLELSCRLLCFVFVFMNFLTFIFKVNCNWCTVLFIRLVMSPGGRLHHTPASILVIVWLAKLCNWCLGRLEARKMMLLKEEEMYMLEECRVGSSIPEHGHEVRFPPPRLVVAGRSVRRCQLYIYIYIYI